VSFTFGQQKSIFIVSEIIKFLTRKEKRYQSKPYSRW